MYSKIMVPVDLAHSEKLGKATSIAAEIAKANNAEVVYVGVAGASPSEAAQDPADYEVKLKGFATVEATIRHIKTGSHVVVTDDPASDLGAKLVAAITETGADLVVMASHIPGLADHVFQSNAGFVASHAPISVYVIR